MTGRPTTSTAFATAEDEGRAALVGYLPAGFPDVDGSVEAMRVLVDGGCDVIEVGLPYSDPVMDGPTIQAAAQQALEAGTRTVDVIRTVEAVAATGVPTVVMTYWNPVERYGVDRFARDLASAGGAGLITPDLVPDEADAWVVAADEHGLDKVFLVAPSSTDERLAMTAGCCRGFVYAAAVMGVTGARESSSELAGPLVARVRAVADVPVGVGIGVSSGAQAAEVATFADGVIVGSAFVRRLLDAGPDRAAGLASLGELARELAEGSAVRERRPVTRLATLLAAALLAAAALTGCGGEAPASQSPVANLSIPPDTDGLHGVVLPRPLRVPHTSLLDTSGRPFDLAAGTRPLTLVFFGYTHCPDVCQVVMANIASSLVRLDPDLRSKVAVVFVTTDPARDTASELRAYLARFDPAFQGATGDLPRIVRLGAALNVPIEKGHRLASGGYDVTHGTDVLGALPDDRVPVLWTQGTDAGALADDITKILEDKVPGL